MSLYVTKAEVIRNHPSSHLVEALQRTPWPDDQNLTLGFGQITPDTKQSHLHRALKCANSTEYVVGGRKTNTFKGCYFAVKVNT